MKIWRPGWRGNLTSVAVGLVAGMAFMSWSWVQGPPRGAATPQPAAAVASVQVTFYNCGTAFPCERVENTSDEPVTVTIRNTHQTQTVTIPAHGSIEMTTDASDNRTGSPTP